MTLSPTQLVETDKAKRTTTSSHMCHSLAQIREPMALDSEVTVGQASPEPAQNLESGAIGRGASAKRATAPVSKPKVVVI